MRLRSLSLITAFLLCWPLTVTRLHIAQSSQSTNQEVLDLKPNQPIERTLKGRETHSYKIMPRAGEYFHVDVDQRGIDVLLALTGPDGKELIERDRPNGKNGMEALSFIATESSEYRLDVKALDEKAEAGRYEIKRETRRSPTAEDKKRIEAETLFQEAQQLGSAKAAESVKQACEKYEAAAALWQEVGDKYAEALTQTSLSNGRVHLREFAAAVAASERALVLYRDLNDRQAEVDTLFALAGRNFALGKKQKEVDYYNQALPLLRAAGDKRREAETLGYIGHVYYHSGEKQKAVDYFDQALPLLRTVGDKSGEAATLTNIGQLYSDLGDKQKALDYYNQALPILRALGDKKGEAVTLNNLGGAYSDLGERQKALDYYNQALPILRAVGDQKGEAITLNNIGLVYERLGESQKALDYYTQALPLRRAMGDKRGEAVTLNNIGLLYHDLGEGQKALDYLNQALPLRRVVGDKKGEAVTLNNLGLAYKGLRERQKALDYFNQALPLRREVGDKGGEAATLAGLAGVYLQFGEKQKALDYDNQSLALFRAVGDKSGEAKSLSNIGVTYSALGEKQKALDYYNQALPIKRALGEKIGEAVTLANMMVACDALNNPLLAVLYGKQSVNTYQQLRANIRGLDEDTQETFLKSVEHTYRHLAKILIKQGRLPEAQAILDLLKEEEFSAVVRGNGGAGEAVPYSKEEEKAIATTSKLAEIGREHDDLLDKGKKGLLDDAGKQRLKQLAGDLRTANEEYQRALAALAAVAQNSEGYEVVSKEAEALKADLRELGGGTVALYTVIVKDEKDETTNGWIILVTPSFQRAYSIDVTNLEQSVFAFRTAASNPVYDPLPLAQQLYKMLFLQTSEKQKTTLAQDLDTYLKVQKNKTLMWSLDGVLRYVPLAALHDGQQYLVEKYRNVVFNTASKTRLKDLPNPAWTALGLGVSERRQEAGLTFTALPGSEKELQKIIKGKDSPAGILPGIVKENKEFTRDAMLDGLLFNNYPVVHISSHFSFQPADFEQSFLLLGQGRWTVQEMRKESTLFTQVDLVTLSACDTAMGQANGKDAEGFAYLAQSLGAKAVIASLWPVDDIGTQVLMPEFYRLHETGLSKGEALQRAQIALLTGQLNVSAANSQTHRSTETVATGASGPDLGRYKPDPQRPFAHPFYWAPFVLIGNWK